MLIPKVASAEVICMATSAHQFCISCTAWASVVMVDELHAASGNVVIALL